MGVTRWVGVASAVMLLATIGACSNNDEAPAVTPSPTATTATPTPRGSSTTTPTSKPKVLATATTKPATAMTTVTLKVLPTEDTACGKCTFIAFTNVSGNLKRLASKVYPDQALTWRIPTSTTRNMSFAVANAGSWQGNGWVDEQHTSALVMQYKGVPFGTRLTPAQVRDLTSGSWCWIGTKQPGITINVVTLKVRYGSPTDDDAWWNSVLPYTRPLAGANGNYRIAYQGELRLDNVAPEPVCK